MRSLINRWEEKESKNTQPKIIIKITTEDSNTYYLQRMGKDGLSTVVNSQDMAKIYSHRSFIDNVLEKLNSRNGCSAEAIDL
ncbi:hypothetical protein DC094_16030 [Pelagibaculum spongiae]|uniref:Uncharacterized protein n=1 Tax=Pelagibaculum spongiae TaxID=2080658 RepID=A0A2V1GU25_9GAMM|nr:hypothetical protein DC094_16030 [Pelagibaculum spongiae]